MDWNPGDTESVLDAQIDARLKMHGLLDPTTPPPDPPPIDPPPPIEPPPSPGTVLYENDFEGNDPFDGWLGRNVSTNLKVIQEGPNRFARLLYQPNSDWICSFLPRRQGVMDLEMTFNARLPEDFGWDRGGGKHFVQLTSINRYRDGNEALEQDGRTRLDFGQEAFYGNWQCTAYRNLIGGDRPGEFAHRFTQGNYFLPAGTWKTVRIRIHINSGIGDSGGTNELIIDDQSLGVMRGEFNVVGSIGGITSFGFGNMDDLTNNPWVDIDNIRIVAR